MRCERVVDRRDTFERRVGERRAHRLRIHAEYERQCERHGHTRLHPALQPSAIPNPASIPIATRVNCPKRTAPRMPVSSG